MDLKEDVAIGDTIDQQEQQFEEEEEHIHILAVDDSSIERKILEKLLTVSSYHVTCVDSGNKALEYLGLLESTTTSFPSSSSACSCETSSPDSSPSSQDQQQHLQGSKVNLIMTDYSMPGMNGYDFLRKVKGSPWKDIPVVVMSSENVPARINMCLEGGAEEFILKPVKLSDLRKLQSHLLKPLIHSCENLDLVENDTDTNVDKNNDNGSNSNVNKRKAISDERLGRRPQMKELVVV